MGEKNEKMAGKNKKNNERKQYLCTFCETKKSYKIKVNTKRVKHIAK